MSYGLLFMLPPLDDADSGGSPIPSVPLEQTEDFACWFHQLPVVCDTYTSFANTADELTGQWFRTLPVQISDALPVPPAPPPALATAMRVRESSGNAEADIPLAVDGYVDETALTTHTGAASGFVTNWHDQSGNDNDAAQVTTTAQPRIVNAGTVDEGLVFDGSNDFLSAPHHPSLAIPVNNGITISAWIKPNTIAGGDTFSVTNPRYIVSKNNTASQPTNDVNYALRLLGGRIDFLYRNASDNGFITCRSNSEVVTSGEWQHVAVVKTASSITLYRNGVSIASTVTGSVSDAGSGHLVSQLLIVGKESDANSNRSFDGAIDSLRIDASNESANIAGIYAGTYEGSPVAWYKATEIAHSMRVRRSNDNAERNILIADGGYVDETDLASHVGANSGFVTSWQDRSGLGNHAVQTTQVSQPRIVNAGTVDEALVFDGSNDFLTLTTPLSFAGEFTVAMWCKRDTTTNHTLIGASPGTNEQFFFNGPNELRVRVFNGGTLSSVAHAVTSTSWNHYAITRDADNKVSLYSNGVFRGKFFADAAQVGTCNLGRIGADIFGSVVYDGSLDQVYAANVALSEAQIAALMNGTLPASGTVLYLKAKDVAP